jgi:hypothetical protein
VKIDVLGRICVEIDMDNGGAEVIAEAWRVEVMSKIEVFWKLVNENRRRRNFGADLMSAEAALHRDGRIAV